jgi:hypothetical protein
MIRLPFTPGERNSGIHWTAGWVGPRAVPDREARGKVLFACEDKPPSPGRSVLSETILSELTRLSFIMYSP